MGLTRRLLDLLSPVDNVDYALHPTAALKVRLDILPLHHYVRRKAVPIERLRDFTDKTIKIKRHGISH